MVLIWGFLTNKDKSNVALKPDISSQGHQLFSGTAYRLF